MRSVFHSRLLSRRRVLVVLLLVLTLGITFALKLRTRPGTVTSNALPSHQEPHLPTNEASIYAIDPNDSWNRIFHLLFSRTIKARIGDDLTSEGPFITIDDGMSGVRASSRTFDRFEFGDRAIDPLYPSFLDDAGLRSILVDPDFSNLKNVLSAALAEKNPRSPLARALMQSDVWAAYDILSARKTFRGAEAGLQQRRAELLALLGRFVKQLVLSSDEIQSLPDNYASARDAEQLPNLFAPGGPWLEIQASPHRLHDFSVDYRRSTRVFLKPVDASMSLEKLLEGLRQEDFFALVDSVALVTQNLLIDDSYTPIPTHLTTEFQIRTFVRDAAGKLVRTDISQYEINRRRLLNDPSRGGLVQVDDKTGVYLPAAGNDYNFASRQFGKSRVDYPVLISLRRRCESCHGRGVSTIFTLSGHHAPQPQLLTVLDSIENAHGWYVASRKRERAEFQALRAQQ